MLDTLLWINSNSCWISDKQINVNNVIGLDFTAIIPYNRHPVTTSFATAVDLPPHHQKKIGKKNVTKQFERCRRFDFFSMTFARDLREKISPTAKNTKIVESASSAATINAHVRKSRHKYLDSIIQWFICYSKVLITLNQSGTNKCRLCFRNHTLYQFLLFHGS